MINLDKENIENAKEVLRLGKGTEFWKLIGMALDDSIAHLQAEQDSNDIFELPAEQYKVMVELLKAKRKYLAHLKNLPDTLIEFLTEPAGNLEEKNFDPYYTEEELKKLSQ